MLSTSLALCEENPFVTDVFPCTMGRDYRVFFYFSFVVSLNKLLKKQSAVRVITDLKYGDAHVPSLYCNHFFRSDGSTVNTFQTFRQDPNSKVYTPLQWRHMGDMVFQTTVNSTMFKSLPRLTKKTHQCIIGHLDSLRKGPAKRKTHFHVMTSYLTRDGDIWTNMVHSPEKEPRTF